MSNLICRYQASCLIAASTAAGLLGVFLGRMLP